jgi:hypothetical protein
MKHIINWLEARLSRSKSADPSDSPSKPKSSKPGKGNLGLPKDMQDLVDDAPMPDRKFLDPSSPDADKTTGFNPYDTANLHKK